MATPKLPTYSYEAGTAQRFNSLQLRSRLGARGYGIYMLLIDLMLQQPDFQLPANYQLLSFAINEDADIIREVAEDFDLFILAENQHGLPTLQLESLNAQLEKQQEIALRRAEAANKRWGSKKSELPKTMQKHKLPKTLFGEDVTSQSVEKKSDTKYYDFENHVNEILSAEAWVKQEADRLEVKPETFCDIFREFVVYTKSKHNCYVDRKEFLMHFARWSEGVGLKIAMANVKQREEERSRQERQQQEHEERKQQHQQMVRRAVKPREYIRMRGYDPDVVTRISCLSNPEWVKNNPPTLKIYPTVEAMRTELGSI